MTNAIQTFYPEMEQKAPVTQAVAGRSFNGKCIVKSSVELKVSRGIVFERVLKSSDLVNTPAAQKKVGWFVYRVTDAGMKSVLKQVTVSRELLLD